MNAELMPALWLCKRLYGRVWNASQEPCLPPIFSKNFTTDWEIVFSYLINILTFLKGGKNKKTTLTYTPQNKK